ncbi:amidohydrolase family protein [Novosphingobium flavum]|uniref:Amidohydrolase family protein n=1 Tax=Novosphingobium flavum TaxID=1778672 RepID=A0A7X1FQP9_9SPHN|nr:amidohydrolase family protein [Novosphingobium flavum]MBC2665178.1 amidohydrolase family protein [Novosphingobium flavum]
MTANSTPPRTLRVGAVLPSAGSAPLGPHAIELTADGRIAALLPLDGAALTPGEAALLAMPALANAHDHGRGLRTQACGIADAPLEAWMVDLARQPRVDPYDTAALAFARMAGSGVAAVYHCHNTQSSADLLAEAEAVSRAARDVGIRAAFGWPFFDANPLVYGSHAALAAWFPPEQREGIAAMDRALRDCATNMALFDQARAFEHPLFALHYHPVAPQWARPETLAAIARASAENGRRVHTHLLETRLQREWADHHFPQGFVNWLDSIGLLSPRLTVAHGVWLREDEIALLAARGVTVAVNVSSNLRLCSGLPPLAELRAGAVPVGLGLDGMALDDDEDMLRELRLAHLLMSQPCRHQQGPVARPDPATALKAAWEGGRAAILGADGGGRIVPGAPADLLLLDRRTMAADCLDGLPADPAWLLARAARAHVARLLVGGREVVRAGQVTGVDEAALSARLVAAASAARAASPPDPNRIAAAAAAAAAFYQSGLHRRPD